MSALPHDEPEQGPDESAEEPIIAGWPMDWPERQSVDLDNVGDPGAWLDEHIQSPAEVFSDDGGDADLAEQLSDDYIDTLRRQGFLLPSDLRKKGSDEAQQTVIEEFEGFLREWRRRTQREREKIVAATAKPVPRVLETWAVLQSFGFTGDSEVWSDIQPGLSFDFGNFKLTASAVVSFSFQEVVMCGGVYCGSGKLAEVGFNISRKVTSPERCAAELVWHLDKQLGWNGQPFRSLNPAPWLEMGRQHFHLLPWVQQQLEWEAEQRALAARPHCWVAKAFARPLLNALAEEVAQADAGETVWFAFDGEVLKVSYGKRRLAAAAQGNTWPEEYGVAASALAEAPKRILNGGLTFGVWKGNFSIGLQRHLLAGCRSIKERSPQDES
jgi:hypothetical protein